MKVKNLFYFLILFSAFILSGCVVRTYSLTKDRVDQDLTGGNRGYLQGEAPAYTPERKTTRTTQVVEVELGSPIKFEKAAKTKPIEKTEEQVLVGNQGYITQGVALEEASKPSVMGATEKYTVQKDDTLQKISKKFYGTTKKWAKIFEANKDTLKGPNKIYPGQTLNIPVDSSVGLKETKENLK